MFRLRWRSALLALLILPAAAPGRARAAAQTVPGQLLVQFKRGVAESRRAALRGALGAHLRRNFAFIRWELLDVGSANVEKALEQAKRDPAVEQAEPNAVWSIDVIPNDPLLSQLYGMHNSGQTGGIAGADVRATLAWNVFTGDPNLKVGIIDTGIDYNHPDLAANVWTNPGEIPGNAVDDDHNGWVDDVHGYDFVNNDGDPFDDHRHGTHVAGTLAGAGNNAIGVTGLSWRCKIVALKFLNAQGSGTTDGALAALQYAIATGVALTNNSWSGGAFSQALYDAIAAAAAANQLYVAAAGNFGNDNDAFATYPASYDLPNIVAVAATDDDDQLAVFSNYGLTSVDLAAPGVDILSCMPAGAYQLLSGTSMAAPHVSGTAALLYGYLPGITYAQVKQRILQHADPIPALAGRCVTGARLNAFMAIADPDSVPPGVVVDLAAGEPGSTTMVLTWTATGDDGNSGRASTYDIRYSTAPIDAGNYVAASSVAGPMPQPAGASESFEIAGLIADTQYWFALKARDEFETAGGLSNVATARTLGAPDIEIMPAALGAMVVAGGSETRDVQIRNAGLGRLDYSVPIPEILMQPSKAGASDGDGAIERRGGPDPFGYRWVDSDEPGGPTFSWVEIAGLGTVVPFANNDQTLTGFPIGFAFPFYGGSFSTVNICSNGFLTFTALNNFYLNQPLPNAGAAVPNNLVAVFWDDLDPRPSAGPGRVYYYNDGSRFIVEYNNVLHSSFSGAGGPYTFEAILYPSGEIRYQYRSMQAPLNSATIGIQDATRTVGLQVAFNSQFVHDDLLVRIFPRPQWLTVVPPGSGRIVADATQTVSVRFDATGLAPGDYDAELHVLSNDADEASRLVPVRMHVVAPTDARSLAVSDLSLKLEGANPARGGARFVLSIPGRETADVRIHDVKGTVVRRLSRAVWSAGAHSLAWDGRDERGSRVASGIYFAHLRAGNSSHSVRFVLLR